MIRNIIIKETKLYYNNSIPSKNTVFVLFLTFQIEYFIAQFKKYFLNKSYSLGKLSKPSNCKETDL